MTIVIPDWLTIPDRQIDQCGNSNQREREKPSPRRTRLWVSDRWLCHSACVQFRAGISSLQHPDPSIDMGQTNRQSEPFTFAAFDRHLAAVLAHNSANDQKAEPGPTGFSCEIGLEHATEIF